MMKFKGTGVALVTPFNEDGSIDEKGLRKLVDHQVSNGTDFLVVQGTTAETPTLSEGEKKKVLEIVIDQNAGRLPVVLGMGGNNTSALIEEIKAFKNEKVDGYLSASPHYNKPSQKGIIEHFKAVSRVSDKPIILYNVPGRTGSNMTAETTLELSLLDNIVAVKEASGSMEQIMNIIQRAPKDFAVLSGDDALTLPIIAAGGHGVISVVANAFPFRFSTLVDAALMGDLETSRKNHYELLKITELFFAEGNPAGVKTALKSLNVCGSTLRLPLVNVSDGLKSAIEKEVEKLS
ncbi:MAG: 4-hydroxy-tetrahydrodipicolinate synthase [Brumimicrobium sp.]|nr:4-hydroxy-tetrahydrodipicolinate synthase [Brumimicrobium sp.]